jgi:signal peptidase II
VTGPAARAWRLAGALCGLVVVVDQVVKAVVEAHIVPGEHVDVLGPLGLTLSHNRGVAFGLAGGAGTRLVVFTLLALGVIAYLFARNPVRPGMWVAVGLLAGGAIGNLADRVRADAVTDYVDLPSWPPFNLADVSITAGVLLLVFLYLRDAESDSPKDEEPSAAGGPEGG